MSKLTSGERKAASVIRPTKKSATEDRRFTEIWLEKNEITGEISEDGNHTDTCLLVKVWKNIIVHEYSANVSGFSEDIGQLATYC